VRVWAAAGLTTPFACGFFRPAVVLPADFDSDFAPLQQEAILAHEVAHLAAGDQLWQGLAGLATAILWWHPLVWWAARQWRLTGEMAADEASQLVPQGPDILAACLVELGRRIAYPSALGWMAAAEPGFRSSLGKRVERLVDLSNLRLGPRARGEFARQADPAAQSCAMVPATNEGEPPSLERQLATGWRPCRPRLFAAAFLGGLLLFVVFGTAWTRSRFTSVEGATTMKMFSNAWHHSLAAAALSTVLTAVPSDLRLAAAAEREGPAREVREGREGERRDAPPATERNPEARRKLEAEAREIRARLEGLKPEQDAEARELKGVLERIERELRGGQRPAREGREGERREGPPRISEEERRDLDREADRIRRELASLKPDQDQEARELRANLERIEQRLRQAAGGERPRGEGDLGAVRRELAEVREAMERAKASGNREDVGRLEDMARALTARLQERAAEARGGAEQAESQRRMAHLRAAIANLHAAGMQDQAEALTRDAERLARERQPEPRAERPRREGSPPPPERFEQVVRELGSQIQEMRQQMEELRRQLREMAEQQRQRAAREERR
jgi:hypothetical protein